MEFNLKENLFNTGELVKFGELIINIPNILSNRAVVEFYKKALFLEQFTDINLEACLNDGELDIWAVNDFIDNNKIWEQINKVDFAIIWLDKLDTYLDVRYEQLYREKYSFDIKLSALLDKISTKIDSTDLEKLIDKLSKTIGQVDGLKNKDIISAVFKKDK